MEQLIADLVDPENTQAAVLELAKQIKEALKDAQTTQNLFEVAKGVAAVPIRTRAALILTKHLQHKAHWKELPLQMQRRICTELPNLLFKVTDQKPLRAALLELTAALAQHENFPKRRYCWFREVLELILHRLNSANGDWADCAVCTFTQLMQHTAALCGPYSDWIVQMYTVALLTQEARGCFASPFLKELYKGMAAVVPHIEGFQLAEQRFRKTIPLFLKTMQAFAQLYPPEPFTDASVLVFAMIDAKESLLEQHAQALLDFCLETINNINITLDIRSRCVEILGHMARQGMAMLQQQQQLECCLKAMLLVLSTEEEEDQSDDHEDEQSYIDIETATPLNTAMQSIGCWAIFLPEQLVLAPLFELTDAALHSFEPCTRRAALLTIAVLASSNQAAMRQTHLSQALKMLRLGIMDSAECVRNAAIFALQQFVQLQPEILEHINVIFPIYMDFLRQMCYDLEEGKPEHKQVELILSALEMLCELLQTKLLPYLPELMSVLFHMLENSERSAKFGMLAYDCIVAIMPLVRERMSPYFKTIMEFIQASVLQKSSDTDNELRAAAINALAGLAQDIGNAAFQPMAGETLTVAMNLLSAAKDVDCCCALYRLFIALASSEGVTLAEECPKMLEHVYATLRARKKLELQYQASIQLKDDFLAAITDKAAAAAETDEDKGLFLEQQELSLQFLYTLAECKGHILAPYLVEGYAEIRELRSDTEPQTRLNLMQTLSAFTVLFHEHGEYDMAQRSVEELMCYLHDIVHQEKDVVLVRIALDLMGYLLQHLDAAAIPTEAIAQKIYDTIVDIFEAKIPKLCESVAVGGGDDTPLDAPCESHDCLFRSACNVLLLLGYAVGTEEFFLLYRNVLPLLLQKLQLEDRNESQQKRSAYILGLVGECMEPLAEHASEYFEDLYAAIVANMFQNPLQLHHNACYALGELVLHSGDLAIEKYPELLKLVQVCLEKQEHSVVMDSVCGLLARLILSQPTLVPLQELLPLYLQHLPLCERFEEYGIIVHSLRYLICKSKHAVALEYSDIILQIVVAALYKQKCDCEETREMMLALVHDIQQKQPTVGLDMGVELKEFLKTIM